MRHRFTVLSAAAFVAIGACAEPVVAPATAPVMDGPSFSAAGAPAADQVFIFSTRGIPADFADRVAAAGGIIERQIPQIGVASVSGLTNEAAAALGASTDISHWSTDVPLMLDAPVGFPEVEAMDAMDAESPASPTNPAAASFYPRQWHLRQIGADAAWAAGRFGSRAVKVGILDTGIDYTHPDLAGLVDLSLSRSFVPSDDAVVQSMFPGAHPVADLHYHGTHVAATVASNGLAAAGVTSNVTLVGIKVLSRTGSGNSLATMDAIVYAADAGLDVINMSLGIAAPLSREQYAWFNELINRTMEYAFAHGVAVVVSAGNENLDLQKLNGSFKAYCTASTVTCVSATGPTARASVNGPWTNPDAKASYSNFGRAHVSVAAPGGNGASTVTAACSRFSLNIPVCRTGTYVIGISGTSMAAPHVTALAALLVENEGHNKPGLVRQRLQQSADDLGQKGTDPIYGKGRINVRTALGL